MRSSKVSTRLILVLTTTILAAAGCVNPTPNPDPTPVPTPKPAVLTVSGNTTLGGTTIGQSQSSIYTVTNTGAGDATLDPGATINFGVLAPYTVTGGTCQTTSVIQANSKNSCTIIVQFTPTVQTLAFQDVTLNYTDPTQDASQDAPLTFKFTLNGFGVLDCTNFPQPQCPKLSASLALSDGPTFDYQTVTIGTLADHTFTVTNSGAASATLGDMSTAGLKLAGPFSVVGGTCTTGASISAINGNCTVTVRYIPTATSLATATMDVSYSSPAGSADATRPIQGTGLLDCTNYPQAQCPPPSTTLTISDTTTYDYQTVTIGTSANHTFTVSNTGAANAVLGDMSTAGLQLSGPFTVVGGTCTTGQTVIASAGSCTITVNFAPTAPALATTTMNIAYTSPAGGENATRSMQGTGVLDCTNYPQPQCPKLAAALSVSDGVTFDYSTVTVGTSADHTFTITNTGQADATLGDMSTAGVQLGAPFTVTGGSCATGATISKLTGSCTLSVHFAPTGAALATGLIDVAYTSPVGTLYATRAIQGTGVLDCLNYPQPQCPPLLRRLRFQMPRLLTSSRLQSERPAATRLQ